MIHDRLVATAVHEAGHAVMATHVGVGIRFAHICPRGAPGRESFGSTVLAGDRGVHELGSRGLLILTAGDVSESLLDEGFRASARPTSIAWYWSNAVDRWAKIGPATAADVEAEKVALLARADVTRVRTMRPTPGQLQGARDAARMILAERWAAVYRIADELLAEGQIDGSRVAAIYKRAAAA